MEKTCSKASSRGKDILTVFNNAYTGIGVVLGMMLWLSYEIGCFKLCWLMGWKQTLWFLFSWKGILILSSIQMLGFLSAPIRAFLWLPSLLWWFFSGSPISFFMWLMPGFFIK
jgi:hypothetical protein